MAARSAVHLEAAELPVSIVGRWANLYSTSMRNRRGHVDMYLMTHDPTLDPAGTDDPWAGKYLPGTETRVAGERTHMTCSVCQEYLHDASPYGLFDDLPGGMAPSRLRLSTARYATFALRGTRTPSERQEAIAPDDDAPVFLYASEAESVSPADIEARNTALPPGATPTRPMLELFHVPCALFWGIAQSAARQEEGAAPPFKALPEVSAATFHTPMGYWAALNLAALPEPELLATLAYMGANHFGLLRGYARELLSWRVAGHATQDPRIAAAPGYRARWGLEALRAFEALHALAYHARFSAADYAQARAAGGGGDAMYDAGLRYALARMAVATMPPVLHPYTAARLLPDRVRGSGQELGLRFARELDDMTVAEDNGNDDVLLTSALAGAAASEALVDATLYDVPLVRERLAVARPEALSAVVALGTTETFAAGGVAWGPLRVSARDLEVPLAQRRLAQRVAQRITAYAAAGEVDSRDVFPPGSVLPLLFDDFDGALLEMVAANIAVPSLLRYDALSGDLVAFDPAGLTPENVAVRAEAIVALDGAVDAAIRGTRAVHTPASLSALLQGILLFIMAASQQRSLFDSGEDADQVPSAYERAQNGAFVLYAFFRHASAYVPPAAWRDFLRVAGRMLQYSEDMGLAQAQVAVALVMAHDAQATYDGALNRTATRRPAEPLAALPLDWAGMARRLLVFGRSRDATLVWHDHATIAGVNDAPLARRLFELAHDALLGAESTSIQELRALELEFVDNMATFVAVVFLQAARLRSGAGTQRAMAALRASAETYGHRRAAIFAAAAGAVLLEPLPDGGPAAARAAAALAAEWRDASEPRDEATEYATHAIMAACLSEVLVARASARVDAAQAGGFALRSYASMERELAASSSAYLRARWMFSDVPPVELAAALYARAGAAARALLLRWRDAGSEEVLVAEAVAIVALADVTPMDAPQIFAAVTSMIIHLPSPMTAAARAAWDALAHWLERVHFYADDEHMPDVNYGLVAEAVGSAKILQHPIMLDIFRRTALLVEAQGPRNPAHAHASARHERTLRAFVRYFGVPVSAFARQATRDLLGGERTPPVSPRPQPRTPGAPKKRKEPPSSAQARTQTAAVRGDIFQVAMHAGARAGVEQLLDDLNL
jgi:hypothetical protein